MMKGYYTGSNYMGYIPGKGYQKFESESAYREVYEEANDTASSFIFEGGEEEEDEKNSLNF